MARGKSEDPSILEYALRALEQERDHLQSKIDDIRRKIGGRASGGRVTGISTPAKASIPVETPKNGTRTKRTLSDSARKRIAAAQKKRWAEHRKSVAPPATKKMSKKAAAASAGE